jgi:hypothetical protein
MKIIPKKEDLSVDAIAIIGLCDCLSGYEVIDDSNREIYEDLVVALYKYIKDKRIRSEYHLYSSTDFDEDLFKKFGILDIEHIQRQFKRNRRWAVEKSIDTLIGLPEVKAKEIVIKLLGTDEEKRNLRGDFVVAANLGLSLDTNIVEGIKEGFGKSLLGENFDKVNAVIEDRKSLEDKQEVVADDSSCILEPKVTD